MLKNYSAHPSHNFSFLVDIWPEATAMHFAPHSDVYSVQFGLFIDIKEHLGVYTQWLYKTHWNGRHLKNQTKKNSLHNMLPQKLYDCVQHSKLTCRCSKVGCSVHGKLVCRGVALPLDKLRIKVGCTITGAEMKMDDKYAQRYEAQSVT